MKKLLKDNLEIMRYWDYNKNDNSILEKVSTGSNKNAWWICDKNHSYSQSIHSKTKGIGCPKKIL